MKVEYLRDVKRIITHANCPDGMASAILLDYVFPHIEIEFYIHSDNSYLNMKAEPGMLFCDIAPPAQRAEEFIENKSIVLDHHKGAKDLVLSFGDRGVFADETEEPGVSGAYLAWREVFSAIVSESLPVYENAKEFARIAGVRDTWQVSNPDFIKSCHQASMLTFYSWDYWHSLEYVDFVFSNEMNVGRKLFEKRKLDVKKCIENSLIYNLNGYKVAIFNDPNKLCSDVAESLRKDGVSIIAGFSYFKKDNNMNLGYSLRSDESFNVQEFASTLGGGGHSRASGFSVPTNERDNPFLKFNSLLKDFLSLQ